MKLKLLFLYALAFVAVSCQFSETMVLNEDGSGTMNIALNMNEMMAFGGGMGMTDSVPVKMDTIINMKQFLEEKKDSISTLSKAEQENLKKLENYNLNMVMNSETSELAYGISTNFKSIAEVNDMLSGLEQAASLMPGKEVDMSSEKKDDTADEIIGVTYSFKKGVFKRDAYIKDEKMHQQQMDSLQQAAAFMSGSKYTLKYTFPKKIKKASNEAATFSEDKKTITLQQPFLDYFKNPDLLDLEVVLEK